MPVLYEATLEEKKKFLEGFYGADKIVPNLNYPFYRKNPYKKFRLANVILFILESWSALELGVFGGHKDASPFFDSLASKVLLFRNCFATNRRSIESFPSIISSIPSFFGNTYITSNYQTNRQTGLGTLFKKKGYNTYFTYAAKKGSMGFDSYARQAGFSQIFTEEDFPKDFPRDGTWGVYDEYVFLFINTLFSKEKNPFLAVIYSLHPHPLFA